GWIPPFQWTVASDLNMPHVWDIGASFVEPAQRNGPPLGIVLVNAGIFTFREAFGGFVFGALLGLGLAIVFVHSRLLERALVPYVVASQTVPIIAIAPVVVIWLRGGWLAVAVISAYLTFFPVTIAGLRGLRSPDPRALELMRSYASSSRDVLFKVRLPAAAPYLFAAFKVAAPARTRRRPSKRSISKSQRARSSPSSGPPVAASRRSCGSSATSPSPARGRSRSTERRRIARGWIATTAWSSRRRSSSTGGPSRATSSSRSR